MSCNTEIGVQVSYLRERQGGKGYLGSSKVLDKLARERIFRREWFAGCPGQTFDEEIVQVGVWA